MLKNEILALKSENILLKEALNSFKS